MLFGSVLRDDFNAGLLIEIDPHAHLSYFDLLELKENFRRILHRLVDMVEKQDIKNSYRNHDKATGNQHNPPIP